MREAKARYPVLLHVRLRVFYHENKPEWGIYMHVNKVVCKLGFLRTGNRGAECIVWHIR
jgi:hypothetical protein